MLNLFAAVFGRSQETRSALPAALLEQLIERAVDGADPRMRIIPGYAKALKRPVAHAADHVIGLIDRLPGPMALEPASLRECPTLAAFLYSAAEAKRLLERDAALLDYRAAKLPVAQPITALLVVQRAAKRGFGQARVGDQALQDVSRTTISFTHHRLLEPASDEAETRRGLKRRAFDQLLALALSTITRRTEQRAELGSQRALLRSKLDIMQRSGGFTGHAGTDERAGLQEMMAEIEQQLAALGPATDVLQGNLDTLVDVLANAERHLWLEENNLYLDRFYVLHDGPDAAAPGIVCRDLRNSEGRQATLQMVQLSLA